jgi:hypothetical protein
MKDQKRKLREPAQKMKERIGKKIISDVEAKKIDLFSPATYSSKKRAKSSDSKSSCCHHSMSDKSIDTQQKEEQLPILSKKETLIQNAR